MIYSLSWESLETRQIKASLHMFYKMFNNHLANIPFNQYAQLSHTITTTRNSHCFKLMPISSKKNPLKFSWYGKNNPNLESITRGTY